MDKATFWQLIDEARQAAKGDNWQQATLLLEKLIALDEEEIIAFNFIFDEFMIQAYLADLWNAADIIGAGCSDDGFMDFRAWLIGQGEHVYEAALKDPEILVDVVEDGFDTQGVNILSVADAAFERKTGFELDYRKVKTLQLNQLGKPLKQKAEAEKEFPKLAAKFGNYEERWEKVIDIMVNPRKELLQQLEESGKQRRYVIAGIDTNKVIYDESGWTVKDLIAHITAWEEEAIRSLQAFYNGSVYTIDKDDHTYNHEQQVKRKDLTIAEVITAWDAVRQEFIAAVTAIPDDRFDQLMTLPWGEQNTPAHLVREMLKHEADHIQEITNKK